MRILGSMASSAKREGKRTFSASGRTVRSVAAVTAVAAEGAIDGASLAGTEARRFRSEVWPSSS